MAVEVETPEEKMGDVIGDLSGRRGVILGMDDLPGSKAIKAEVPLNECSIFHDLAFTNASRATYTMEFKHYAEAPKSVATPSSTRTQGRSRSHMAKSKFERTKPHVNVARLGTWITARRR